MQPWLKSWMDHMRAVCKFTSLSSLSLLSLFAALLIQPLSFCICSALL